MSKVIAVWGLYMVAKAKRELSRHSENKWIVLALLALAQFMVILDVSIVNVALPSIAKDLHFSPNNLQWVITAYTLTFGGFLLLGGRAADLFGRRRIFITAVFFFALMSLFCGLAHSEGQLIVARALQGLAAAFMSPAALSIVITSFKEGKERNTAMGVWAGVAAGGAAVGVLLGGILTQYLSWRWNFFVNVPVGVLVVFGAMRLLPHHIGEEDHKLKLDLPGAALATGGLMSLVYGLSKAPNDGWSSGTVISFLLLSAVLLVSFIFNEVKVASQPLMPLEVFKIRNVAGGNLAFLAIDCSLFSMFFFVTLYMQQVLGYSPVKAGLSMLPITFIIGGTSAFVSKMVGKVGYKPFMVAGPLTLSIGLFTLSHIMKVGGGYLGNILPGLAICALGMGFSFVSGTLAATSGVPKHFSGLASGILNTSQQVGGAIGLAVLSAVFASTLKTDLAAQVAYPFAQVHGFHSGLRVGSGLALLGSLVALLVIKNQKVKPDITAGV
jgi:EmrB/QacA subfamily drug resistance transporter